MQSPERVGGNGPEGVCAEVLRPGSAQARCEEDVVLGAVRAHLKGYPLSSGIPDLVATWQFRKHS